MGGKALVLRFLLAHDQPYEQRKCKHVDKEDGREIICDECGLLFPCH